MMMKMMIMVTDGNKGLKCCALRWGNWHDNYSFVVLAKCKQIFWQRRNTNWVRALSHTFGEIADKASWTQNLHVSLGHSQEDPDSPPVQHKYIKLARKKHPREYISTVLITIASWEIFEAKKDFRLLTRRNKNTRGKYYNCPNARLL